MLLTAICTISVDGSIEAAVSSRLEEHQSLYAMATDPAELVRAEHSNIDVCQARIL